MGDEVVTRAFTRGHGVPTLQGGNRGIRSGRLCQILATAILFLQIPHHIHPLMRNSYHINSVTRQGIENGMASFGKTIITLLDVVAALPGNRIL